jgi:hypothetical protein
MLELKSDATSSYVVAHGRVAVMSPMACDEPHYQARDGVQSES